jgi:hypothetical protein
MIRFGNIRIYKEIWDKKSVLIICWVNLDGRKRLFGRKRGSVGDLQRLIKFLLRRLVVGFMLICYFGL